MGEYWFTLFVLLITYIAFILKQVGRYYPGQRTFAVPCD
jgi:hypothetical protein